MTISRHKNSDRRQRNVTFPFREREIEGSKEGQMESNSRSPDDKNRNEGTLTHSILILVRICEDLWGVIFTCLTCPSPMAPTLSRIQASLQNWDFSPFDFMGKFGRNSVCSLFVCIERLHPQTGSTLFPHRDIMDSLKRNSPYAACYSPLLSLETAEPLSPLCIYGVHSLWEDPSRSRAVIPQRLIVINGRAGRKRRQRIIFSLFPDEWPCKCVKSGFSLCRLSSLRSNGKKGSNNREISYLQ